MKVSVETNKDGVIIAFYHLASEQYQTGEQTIDVNDLDEIVQYKTKVVNGQLVQLDDYVPEYYSQQEREEQMMNLEIQISALNEWFDKYDLQIKEYQRNQRLGIQDTYHIDGIAYTISELDAMAQTKAVEMKNLREELAEIPKI